MAYRGEHWQSSSSFPDLRRVFCFSLGLPRGGMERCRHSSSLQCHQHRFTLVALSDAFAAQSPLQTTWRDLEGQHLCAPTVPRVGRNWDGPVLDDRLAEDRPSLLGNAAHDWVLIVEWRWLINWHRLFFRGARFAHRIQRRVLLGRVVDFHRNFLAERERLVATLGQHHIVPYVIAGQQLPVAPGAGPDFGSAGGPVVLEPDPLPDPAGKLTDFNWKYCIWVFFYFFFVALRVIARQWLQDVADVGVIAAPIQYAARVNHVDLLQVGKWVAPVSAYLNWSIMRFFFISGGRSLK